MIPSLFAERTNITIRIDADHTIFVPAKLGGELMQGTIQIVIAIWATIVRYVGRDKPNAPSQARDLQVHETHSIRTATIGNVIVHLELMAIPTDLAWARVAQRYSK